MRPPPHFVPRRPGPPSLYFDCRGFFNLRLTYFGCPVSTDNLEIDTFLNELFLAKAVFMMERDLVKSLIGKFDGAIRYVKPLREAVATDNLSLVKLILETIADGAHPERNELLTREAVLDTHNGRADSLLKIAVQLENTMLVQILIDNGADTLLDIDFLDDALKLWGKPYKFDPFWMFTVLFKASGAEVRENKRNLVRLFRQASSPECRSASEQICKFICYEAMAILIRDCSDLDETITDVGREGSPCLISNLAVTLKNYNSLDYIQLLQNGKPESSKF